MTRRSLLDTISGAVSLRSLRYPVLVREFVMRNGLCTLSWRIGHRRGKATRVR